MASKLKTEVHINDDERDFPEDITLELTFEQATKLLEALVAGETAHINLKTPTNGAVLSQIARDNPKAYAS